MIWLFASSSSATCCASLSGPLCAHILYILIPEVLCVSRFIISQVTGCLCGIYVCYREGFLRNLLRIAQVLFSLYRCAVVCLYFISVLVIYYYYVNFQVSLWYESLFSVNCHKVLCLCNKAISFTVFIPYLFIQWLSKYCGSLYCVYICALYNYNMYVNTSVLR